MRTTRLASELRAIPLFGLRLAHATILLSAGVPVHIVSSRLGHADPTITVNVYAHCLPRAQQADGQVPQDMGTAKASQGDFGRLRQRAHKGKLVALPELPDLRGHTGGEGQN